MPFLTAVLINQSSNQSVIFCIVAQVAAATARTTDSLTETRLSNCLRERHNYDSYIIEQIIRHDSAAK